MSTTGTERKGRDVEASDVIRLPFATSTPAMARTRLASFLTRHRATTQVIDNALIVISEMIANAVSHGSPDADGSIEICWSIKGDLLELSVLDGGHVATLTPLEFDEDSLSGRGLSIINRVADRWWVDMDQGTRVHAALSLSAQ